MVESRWEVSQGHHGAQCVFWEPHLHSTAKMQFSLICALYTSYEGYVIKYFAVCFAKSLVVARAGLAFDITFVCSFKKKKKGVGVYQPSQWQGPIKSGNLGCWHFWQRFLSLWKQSWQHLRYFPKILKEHNMVAARYFGHQGQVNVS